MINDVFHIILFIPSVFDIQAVQYPPGSFLKVFVGVLACKRFEFFWEIRNTGVNKLY